MAITQAHSRMVSDVDAGSTYLQGTLGTAANNVVQLDGGTFYFNRTNTDTDNTSFPRTISTITATEIGA